MPERETWASRIGFVLAAVGSAVGLGNIWRFPWVAAENGGAAFLVVYLAAAVGIGFPAMLAEFAIGRRAKRNVVDAFERIGFPRWRFVGAIGMLTALGILSYYVVVGGWVLRYLMGSLTGAYFGDPSGYFETIASGPEALGFAALFMLVTVVIVAAGVEDGIERAALFMVPSIVVLLVVLAAWAATLEGAAAGYDYFLAPEFDALAANLGTIVPFAVGQAFFSLSLGMGIMLTYSSYVGSDDNLGVDAISIVVTNTLVGVLAGFVAFPLLFAQDVQPGDPGAGAIFVSIATAFARLPAGQVLGVAFFGVVAIAAFSSSISLLEVGISYVVDNYDVGRPVAATGVGLAVFLAGVPSALSTATLGSYDAVANSLLLPVGVLLVLAFVGWVYDEGAVAELRQGIAGGDRELTAWLWHVRTLLLLAVVFTLGLGVAELLGLAG